MMVAQQRIITPTCKPRAMYSVMKHDNEEGDGNENPEAVENALAGLDQSALTRERTRRVNKELRVLLHCIGGDALGSLFATGSVGELRGVKLRLTDA
jgi:hypothetical protein